MTFHSDVKRQLEIQQPLLEIRKEEYPKSLNTHELMLKKVKPTKLLSSVGYTLSIQGTAATLDLDLDPLPSISPQTSW